MTATMKAQLTCLILIALSPLVGLYLHHHLAARKPPGAAIPPIPSFPLIAPVPSASASSPFDDFDFEKKNRQIRWCEAHHGVPAMTFTRYRSNVLCLDPRAVIPLPQGDAGR